MDSHRVKKRTRDQAPTDDERPANRRRQAPNSTASARSWRIPSVNTASTPIIAPAPPEGWPRRQGRNAWINVANLHPTHRDSFANYARDNTGIFARLFDGRPPTQTTAGTDATRIANVIRAATGNPDIRVSPPRPEDVSPEALAEGPFNFLVTGISEDEYDDLLNAGTINTDVDTVMFERVGLADPQHQFYLMSLTGFATDNSADILSAIRELFNDDGFIAALHAADQEGRSPEESLEALLDSMWIDSLPTRITGGTTRSTITVYATLPTDDPFQRFNLTRLAQRLSFNDPIMGWVEVHPGFRCSRCHGQDHPSGLCPLPLISGWVGPPPIPSQSGPTQTQLITNTSGAQLIPDMPADPVVIAQLNANRGGLRGRGLPNLANRGGRGKRGRGRGGRGI